MAWYDEDQDYYQPPEWNPSQVSINGITQPVGNESNIPPPPDLSNKWMWDGTKWVQNTAPPIIGDSQGGLSAGWAVDNSGNYSYAAPPPLDNTTGPNTRGTGAVLPPGSIGSLLQPFGLPMPTYSEPDLSGSPAPDFPTLPSWASPTEEQASNLPGYKFARDQALLGLDQSAAARGVTNTGGTLQDIIKFGDQFAAQNYQTARANSLEDYQANLATQYLLPYQAKYDAWSRTNDPRLSLDAANSKNNFSRGTWQDQYAAWRNRNLDTFNQLYSLSTLGAGVQ